MHKRRRAMRVAGGGGARSGRREEVKEERLDSDNVIAPCNHCLADNDQAVPLRLNWKRRIEASARTDEQLLELL